jgi:protocatechuate 3,4-dioxygenase beta subunit
MLNRRELLALFGAGFGAPVAACGSSTPSSPTTSSTSSTTSTTSTTTVATSGNCAVIPSETEGPYPDKLGMLGNSAFFRRDVREGKSGTPLALTLTIVNVSGSCAPIAGANVEIWQCDAAGNYSEYSQPGFDGTGQTFLRGLQTTDANGQVTFTTIYPGWYMGRATHIHVDVFRSGALAKTTQIAFPEDVSRAVYASGVYASKGQNTTSNAGDNVFSDGTSLEMASIAGSPAGGYIATLTIGI